MMRYQGNMATDEEPHATGPTSIVRHNNMLDRHILKREPPDEITRAAPWYQRLWQATLYSTSKAWLGCGAIKKAAERRRPSQRPI